MKIIDRQTYEKDDTLAKIAFSLQCGLDDVVEIQNEAERKV